ncbi:hypothetical protein [Phycicoccus jejuensis]|uniref:hypothetical protein n=1 Tax=Phycicoccus jejuensis TaxID=367299 RepID=UPI0004C2DE1B|nr:hypothetical protein [Phycicoccus jejuensis]
MAEATRRGIWAVLTDPALYLLDLEQQQAVRLPALDRRGRPVTGSAAPELDGIVLRLLEHGPMTPGRELSLLLGCGDAHREHITARVRRLTRVEPEVFQESPLARSAGGAWAVRTLTSTHLWDLDANTYTRLPGPSATAMAYDGRPLQIHQVLRWPRVGRVSYLTCHDPLDESTEQWRQSATIIAIQQVS